MKNMCFASLRGRNSNLNLRGRIFVTETMLTKYSMRFLGLGLLELYEVSSVTFMHKHTSSIGLLSPSSHWRDQCTWERILQMRPRL